MEPETRNSKLETVSVFFGEASDAVARVYARLSGPQEGGLTLSGHVIGPFCQYANTLPAQVPLTDKGAGEGLLAEAIVPDPCFWTPELPFLYRVQVELRRGNEVLQTAERQLGIRRLGARGKDLFLEGKRYVIRGVSLPGLAAAGTAASESALLPELHAMQTALCVPSPSDDLCEAASRLGVLIVAEVGDVTELERLSRWSAVGIAVLGHDADVTPLVRSAAPNLLFAHSEPWSLSPLDFTPQAWAQLLVCDASSSTRCATMRRSCSLPILAQRRLPKRPPLAEARAACDRLQGDLAPLGDFAGYLV